MDVNQPGTVWKLHFELARLHLELGDEVRAAEEVWLAGEARTQAGWGMGRQVEDFRAENARHIEPILSRLDLESTGAARERARGRYTETRTRILRRLSRPAEIVALRSSFGFLRVEKIPGDVFFPARLLGRQDHKRGDRLRAVVVRSFDPKKGRESHQAVWLGPEE
jgi:hypothetical protein